MSNTYDYRQSFNPYPGPYGYYGMHAAGAVPYPTQVAGAAQLPYPAPLKPTHSSRRPFLAELSSLLEEATSFCLQGKNPM